MSNMQVAETILQQLGGRRFIAMTGAKSFVGDDSGLSFGIPRGAKNKANKVRITLCGDDTYRVAFSSVRGTSAKQISEHESVYNDRLQDLFTEQTGLYTRF